MTILDPLTERAPTMTGPELPQVMMTTDEVAELLNLSPVTVRRRAKAGTLPSYLIEGIGWRFDRSEIEAWMTEHRPPVHPDDMTVEEVAELVRVNPATIRRRAKAGAIPGARNIPGVGWRFSRQVILDELERRRYSGPTAVVAAAAGSVAAGVATLGEIGLTLVGAAAA